MVRADWNKILPHNNRQAYTTRTQRKDPRVKSSRKYATVLAKRGRKITCLPSSFSSSILASEFRRCCSTSSPAHLPSPSTISSWLLHLHCNPYDYFWGTWRSTSSEDPFLFRASHLCACARGENSGI